MKQHPAQSDTQKIQTISDLFKESMDKKGIRPVNPWKAKRLKDWLDKMGARFQPETHNYRSLYRVDTQNYVNFKVHCESPRPSGRGRRPRLIPKIKGRNELRWVRIEIPWDLADKILVLGHLP